MVVREIRVVRKKRNSFVPTSVRGVRLDDEFWEKCNLVAKTMGISRNELFLLALTEYLSGKGVL